MLLRKSSSSSQFPLSLFYRTDAGARSSRVIPPKRRRDHDDAWQNAGIISWPQRQYLTSTRTPAFTVSLLPRMVLSPAYPRIRKLAKLDLCAAGDGRHLVAGLQ